MRAARPSAEARSRGLGGAAAVADAARRKSAPTSAISARVPRSTRPLYRGREDVACRVAVVAEATLQTGQGRIRIELLSGDAPKTVGNFERLSGDGFYEGLTFHRVIEDFMIQGGCPRGDGTGGPGYTFEDEPSEQPVVRGALAMANSGPDTNGSQFFIVTAEACPWLDGKHTVFGRVVEGMEVVDAISRVPSDSRDRPLEPVTIESITLAS